MGQLNPYYIICEKTMWQLFIVMDIEPFLYYFVITRTPNLSNVRYKCAYLNQYLPSKNRKGSMRQLYPYSTGWEKTIVLILDIYGAISIFLLFCNHQDTKTE